MEEGSDHDAARAEMDGEHRLQMNLIAVLERAVAACEPLDEVRELVGRLLDVTDIHFMSEQLAMRLAAYPDLRGHEVEHDHLMERLRALQAAFDLNDSDVAVHESRLLRDLLVRHMESHDLLLSRFLAENRDFI